MIIIKYIPNVITSIRIIGSILLFILRPLSNTFLGVYIICGLSDVVDGYIARKFKCISNTGAILDSIADVIFIFSMMIIIIPLFKWSWWMLGWIGVIALIRLISVLIGFIKYKTVVFLHTYSNKITGLLLFCIPVLYNIVSINILIFFICVVATLSAIEEMFINITSYELSRNVKSIFKI